MKKTLKKKNHKEKNPETSQSWSDFTNLQIDKRALTECMKERDHDVSDTGHKISRPWELMFCYNLTYH